MNTWIFWCSMCNSALVAICKTYEEGVEQLRANGHEYIDEIKQVKCSLCLYKEREQKEMNKMEAHIELEV